MTTGIPLILCRGILFTRAAQFDERGRRHICVHLCNLWLPFRFGHLIFAVLWPTLS